MINEKIVVCYNVLSKCFVLDLSNPLVVSLVYCPHVWGKLDGFKLQVGVLPSIAPDKSHLVILWQVGEGSQLGRRSSYSLGGVLLPKGVVWSGDIGRTSCWVHRPRHGLDHAGRNR